VPRATPHDLRRTHGTTITSLGFGRDALNRIQNHREGGIADVYDQHKYAEENKRVMEAVANRIMALALGSTGPSNVVRAALKGILCALSGAPSLYQMGTVRQQDTSPLGLGSRPPADSAHRSVSSCGRFHFKRHSHGSAPNVREIAIAYPQAKRKRKCEGPRGRQRLRVTC
jgi:hypothetical protein